MDLSGLLVIHAALTLSAGIVLIAAPRLIPSAVGIDVDSSSYLLCYLLGSAQLSLAVLSYFGRRLRDISALRLVCLTLIVFHVSTVIVEVVAFLQGVSAAIWANVAARVLIIILFIYYGFYKTPKRA